MSKGSWLFYIISGKTEIATASTERWPRNDKLFCQCASPQLSLRHPLFASGEASAPCERGNLSLRCGALSL